MAALQTAQTADGVSSGVSVTGPCTVFFDGESVWDNALVEIQMSETDSPAKYKSAGDKASTRDGTPIKIDATGSYHIRARQVESTSRTTITSTVVQ